MVVPGTSAPSASRHVPQVLADLRTNSAGSPVSELTIVAIGTPPSSSPPTRSVSSGIRGTIASATRRNAQVEMLTC